MIRWATTRPAVVWAFGLALTLAGGVAFTRLPLATRTQVELPRLTVASAWPGASAELLETYVTSPIEAAIQGVRGVRKTNSSSSDRGASITVELEPEADVQLTRLGIHERLELLREELPLGVSSPTVSNFVPEELEEQPLLQYTVSGPYTPGALRRIADEQIVPRLSAVAGVGSVQVSGGAETGVSVSYDAQRLRQLGLSPQLIATAIQGARMVRALGEEQAGSTVRPVVLRDQPNALEDLGELPIAGAGGRVFRLADLASIRPEEDTRGNFSRLNGRTAVSLGITRTAGADVIHTAGRVRAMIAEIQRVLPPGISTRLEFDESVDLAKQLKDLTIRGAIAFAAVCLVLLLTMRHLRSVLLVMGSAAVAIAGTALGLYLFRIPANLLTLAGLGMGIGILVQNGVVVVERLRHAPPGPAGRAEAGRRITPAVLGSTLTTAVVLFPFLYLQGNARAAFVPFAAAFSLALAWSVVSSVVMIPAVGTGRAAPIGVWPRVHALYLRVLRVPVRFHWVTIGLVTAILGVVTWGFVKRVERFSFGNWYGQRTTLGVSINFPRGSDPESVDRAVREFERIAVGRDGVDRVEAMGTRGQGRVQVTFIREAGLTALPAMMQEEMTERAVLVGGANINVYGRGPGFSSGGAGASVAFRIKLLGYSYAGVERLARDLQTRLETIPRVRNVNINAASFWGSDRAVSVTLAPDRPALNRAGLTSRDLAAAVNREVQGPAGGQRLELEGEEVIVSVKSRGARDRTLDQLRAALVPTAGGSPVRIGDLAGVDEKEGLGTISREDQQYVRIVAYDFRGPQRLANRTHQAFMRSISVPAGYSVSDQGFSWDPDESAKGLWLVFAVGVALVILAVAVVFDSAWAAWMVFLSLPLALAGVAGIFWATGVPFSREAAVGVILVVGLAVNQTILLIDAALERRRGRRVGVEDALHAAGDRAGMIVLVTLTTLASLIPLAVGTDTDSLFGSIALATSGGTLAGTIGALFIVPALLVGRRERRQATPPAGPESPVAAA
ncbi:MAG: efflux RND transporter permease subunit [Gemmatimonadales bacterium]